MSWNELFITEGTSAYVKPFRDSIKTNKKYDEEQKKKQILKDLHEKNYRLR